VQRWIRKSESTSIFVFDRTTQPILLMSDNRYYVKCAKSLRVARALIPRSDSSSFTRRVVIRGESAGKSTTWIPFTVRVRMGGRNPLRTRSHSALPRVREWLAASKSYAYRSAVYILRHRPEQLPQILAEAPQRL
jgi:hypothetical protein